MVFASSSSASTSWRRASRAGSPADASVRLAGRSGRSRRPSRDGSTCASCVGALTFSQRANQLQLHQHNLAVVCGTTEPRKVLQQLVTRAGRGDVVWRIAGEAHPVAARLTCGSTLVQRVGTVLTINCASATTSRRRTSRGPAMNLDTARKGGVAVVSQKVRLLRQGRETATLCVPAAALHLVSWASSASRRAAISPGAIVATSAAILWWRTLAPKNCASTPWALAEERGRGRGRGV